MQKIILTVFLLGLVSCSGLKKAALGPAGSLIYDASNDLLHEDDWQFFEESLISNIKLIETLLSQDPNNEELKVTLIKALSAKAFAIDETYYLEHKLKDTENSIHKKRAKIAYTKALKYSASLFKSRGLSESLLTDYVAKPDELKNVISENFDDDSELDIEFVFFTGQSLASIVNLSRENFKVVAYLPVAKALFDWACEKRPNINGGACDIFSASYMAARPRMLGGNPEKGREMFEKAISERSDNYLVREAMVENYQILVADDVGYRRIKNDFGDLKQKLKDSKVWTGEKLRAPEKNSLNVFNMIALKRMEILEANEDDIF